MVTGQIKNIPVLHCLKCQKRDKMSNCLKNRIAMSKELCFLQPRLKIPVLYQRFFIWLLCLYFTVACSEDSLIWCHIYIQNCDFLQFSYRFLVLPPPPLLCTEQVAQIVSVEVTEMDIELLQSGPCKALFSRRNEQQYYGYQRQRAGEHYKEEYRGTSCA